MISSLWIEKDLVSMNEANLHIATVILGFNFTPLIHHILLPRLLRTILTHWLICSWLIYGIVNSSHCSTTFLILHRFFIVHFKRCLRRIIQWLLLHMEAFGWWMSCLWNVSLSLWLFLRPRSFLHFGNLFMMLFLLSWPDLF